MNLSVWNSTLGGRDTNQWVIYYSNISILPLSISILLKIRFICIPDGQFRDDGLQENAPFYKLSPITKIFSSGKFLSTKRNHTSETNCDGRIWCSTTWSKRCWTDPRYETGKELWSFWLSHVAMIILRDFITCHLNSVPLTSWYIRIISIKPMVTVGGRKTSFALIFSSNESRDVAWFQLRNYIT